MNVFSLSNNLIDKLSKQGVKNFYQIGLKFIPDWKNLNAVTVEIIDHNKWCLSIIKYGIENLYRKNEILE